jgi:hypothetical protein
MRSLLHRKVKPIMAHVLPAKAEIRRSLSEGHEGETLSTDVAPEDYVVALLTTTNVPFTETTHDEAFCAQVVRPRGDLDCPIEQCSPAGHGTLVLVSVGCTTPNNVLRRSMFSEIGRCVETEAMYVSYLGCGLWHAALAAPDRAHTWPESASSHVSRFVTGNGRDNCISLHAF